LTSWAAKPLPAKRAHYGKTPRKPFSAKAAERGCDVCRRTEKTAKADPFIGPAGLLLDKALIEAGVDRKRVYVTNAVNHFKFEPRANEGYTNVRTLAKSRYAGVGYFRRSRR
jgi:hypothetical protein